MEIKNYYQILGIEKTASSKEIKEAYLKLIKQFHPDKIIGKSDPEKFQDIVEAYNVLGDLDNRLHYSFVMSQNKFNRKRWVRRFNLPISVAE